MTKLSMQQTVATISDTMCGLAMVQIGTIECIMQCIQLL